MRAHKNAPRQRGTQISLYRSGDGDPPERLVLKRGRKQACCVRPCSRSLRGMAGRRGQRGREKQWNTLAPLTRVWYFLFLFHKTQFFVETFQCAGHSVSTLRCCSLCHGLEGQWHPQKPHLVCQQVFQLTVHQPLSICSPSATTVCPIPSPLFTVSPPVCPFLTHSLQVSHTLLLLSAFDKNTQAFQAVWWR